MRKYEENRYILDNIKEHIYPWVRGELACARALNGKNITEKDTPIVSFINGLKIIFVIKRGEDVYEVLKDNMLPPGCDVEALYFTACENLVRDVEFVIANTWYGGFAILADGRHEASWLCFKHIWQVCADKLKDDLVIMMPCKDTSRHRMRRRLRSLSSTANRLMSSRKTGSVPGLCYLQRTERN